MINNSSNDRSVTNQGDRQGPFSFEFMVPEEKDSYGSGTIFIRVPDNPTIISKEFIVEKTIMFFVQFDPEEKTSFLLERRVWSD